MKDAKPAKKVAAAAAPNTALNIRLAAEDRILVDRAAAAAGATATSGWARDVLRSAALDALERSKPGQKSAPPLTPLERLEAALARVEAALPGIGKQLGDVAIAQMRAVATGEARHTAQLAALTKITHLIQ